MARKRKKRQKAQQRKATRRKKKGTSRRGRSRAHPLLRMAGRWPLHEVLLARDWQKEGQIVQIIVARRSSMGQIAAGTFLVDLGCLGVKSAFASLLDSQREYEQKLRWQLTSQQELAPADLNLVAKIIREGIAYARQLGFSPDRDYRDAMAVLGNADPDACPDNIPLGGKDGRPYFFAGPYDDVPAIMAQLTKVCGPDGFTYFAPIGPDTEIFLDDEL
ncbi:MAG: hypothetical protein ACE5F6_17340 [Anaerolineae bacterium]